MIMKRRCFVWSRGTGLQPGNHGCLRLEDRDGCVTLSPGEVWEGSFWLSFS